MSWWWQEGSHCSWYLQITYQMMMMMMMTRRTIIFRRYLKNIVWDICRAPSRWWWWWWWYDEIIARQICYEIFAEQLLYLIFAEQLLYLIFAEQLLYLIFAEQLLYQIFDHYCMRYLQSNYFLEIFAEHRADDEFSASVLPARVHPWRQTTPPWGGEYTKTNINTEIQKIVSAKNGIVNKNATIGYTFWGIFLQTGIHIYMNTVTNASCCNTRWEIRVCMKTQTQKQMK